MKSMHPAALAAVAAAVLAIVPAASAQEPMTVAIRNARLVPVSGPVVETGTIVLSGGLIRAVGPRVEVPAEAVVIDGTGL
ncbi:MAG: amidohydrolase, partial [Vicinamibacteria bacterium]